MKPTTLVPRILSAILIVVFLAAVAAAQPTYKTGTPKNQVISVGWPPFECSTTLYDPEVYKLSDGRLVLWGQGGSPGSFTLGIDSLYTATYKPSLDNWRTPSATEDPTLTGTAFCDHLKDVNPDPSGPVGSPSAVQLNGKVYMAYVAGNADYERGKVQWAVGTDMNLAIQPSAANPISIVIPSQIGRDRCYKHGIGQVRLAYEAPFFYFILFYSHNNDPGGGPYSTLAYRINYDPAHPSGLGTTREIFTRGAWVAHDGTLIWEYDSLAGLPVWNNYDARGLEYAGEGDLKWDPLRNRWIHIFSTWCTTKVQWQETTDLAGGVWSAPVDVDVSSIRAKYPSTPFVGAGFWYGDATDDNINNPRRWVFLPVHGGAACANFPFAGLGVVMAPIDFVSATTKYALTVRKDGSGSGTVTSSPTGIDCGACCSHSYTSGTVVTLTPTPAPGSTFAGWSGDLDCTDGIVTMNPPRTCTATFNTPASTYPLTVTKAGTGGGTVTSNPAGINCGPDCSENYNPSTIVNLTPVPATGSTFASWGGDSDCTDGSVTMNAARNCIATFNAVPSTNLAVGKLTFQSSLYGAAPSERAVDGNTDGNYFNGSLTHTALDAQAWWQVDLGSVSSIDQIKVWNRTDCCAERLSNFYVLVSNTLFTSTDLSTTLNQPGVSNYYTAATAGRPSLVAVGRSGRYVRVQLAGSNYLSIAEVEVLGQPGTPPSDTVWFEDNTPSGAVTVGDNGDGWNWIDSSIPPGPYSGSRAHQSNLYSGMHQHYFYGATQTLTVNQGDVLFAYVYLDPSNPPSEVMLQWSDGSWEHRAYWGANQITFGSDGTIARRYMGTLPPAGRWVRLEVAASTVGVEGRTLHGMAFTLFGGRATWDRAGKNP